MKSSRYSPEQVAFAMRQAESGTPVPEVCRKMGIAEQTFLPLEEEVCRHGRSGGQETAHTRGREPQAQAARS